MFLLPRTAIGKGSPSPYLDPKLLNSVFSYCPVEAEWEWLMGVWPLAKVNPHTLYETSFHVFFKKKNIWIYKGEKEKEDRKKLQEN